MKATDNSQEYEYLMDKLNNIVHALRWEAKYQASGNYWDMIQAELFKRKVLDID